MLSLGVSHLGPQLAPIIAHCPLVRSADVLSLPGPVQALAASSHLISGVDLMQDAVVYCNTGVMLTQGLTITRACIAQDAVVRGGKLIRMYKRPGHRVIINTDGDLIVRPMFVEASIQRVPGGSAVSHHVLAAYQRSYVAVMKSQFSAKGVQGGREVRRV